MRKGWFLFLMTALLLTVCLGVSLAEGNGCGIIAEDWEFTYDGKAHETPAMLEAGSGIVQGRLQYATSTDGNTYSGYSYTVPSFKDAGVYYVKAHGTDGTQTEEAKYIVIIHPREITVYIKSASKVYDGKPLVESGFTVGGDGFVSGEGISSLLTMGLTDAGTKENELNPYYDNPITFAPGTKASNYSVMVVPGTLTVAKRKVTVISKNAVVKYDDCPAGGLSNNEPCTVDGDGFVEGEMAPGYPKGNGLFKKPNTEPLTFSMGYNSILYSWTGNGQESNYDITEIKGSFFVTNSTYKIFAVSHYQGVYDGETHGLSDLAANYSNVAVTYTWTDSQGTVHTDELTPPAIKDVKINSSTGAVEFYKVVVKVYNTPSDYVSLNSYIRILPRELFLTAGSASREYNGQPLTCGDYLIGGDGLAPSESLNNITMTSDSSQTNAGSTENVIKELTDASFTGGGKCSNYSIVYSNGTLEVTPRKVTLYSASAQKPYDGTPLSDNTVTEGFNGFASGEGAQYSAFLSPSEIGSVRNEFTYQLNPNTNLDNYILGVVTGVLTVYSKDTVPEPVDPPKTGDEANTTLWMMIAAAALLCGVWLLRRRTA